MEVKNRTRGILNQLGLGVATRAIGTGFEQLITEPAMRNFFTVMAGAVADSLPVAIEKAPADTTDTKQYGFTYRNHHTVILWRNVEPQPLANDPGVPVTITLAGFAGAQVTGVDVLNGFEQQLVTSDEDSNLVIRGLFAKDYPIIVRFSKTATIVTLTIPADGSFGESAFTFFEWQEVAGAGLYHLQVDPDSQFTSAVINDSTLTSTSYTPQSPLSYSATYFWRVRAGSSEGVSAAKTTAFGPWSEVRSFTVAVGTAAEADRSGIPTSYALRPNYPNPFNPDAVGTTIQIDLPETAHVQLAVYDVLGRRVAELVNGPFPAGYHSAVWDAEDVGSGVYFYRLET